MNDQTHGQTNTPGMFVIVLDALDGPEGDQGSRRQMVLTKIG